MDRLGAIVRLKLRLAMRQGRGPMGVVGLVLMLLFFVLPFGIGLAVFAYVGLRTLDPGAANEFRHLLLGGVLAFWLTFPIVGFSLNQSYDLTRLFIYPLHKRTIFVANLLACFVDPTLLLLLPLLGVLAVRSATSPLAAALAALALLLFLAQTLALSQAILWGLLNVLRSRRMRDWALLVAPLLALTVYLGPQLLVHGAMGPHLFERLVAWHPARYLGPSPVGMAAGTLRAAEAGQYLTATLYLLGAAAYLFLTVLLGGFVLSRLYLGEIGAYPRERRQATRGSRLQRLPTTPLASLALKEARYYWRDPRHKSMFIAPLFPLAVVLVGALASHIWTPTSALAFTGFVCLTGFASLFQNIFGVDREGLRLLFVTPCSREDILLGKNLAAIVVATLATTVAVMVVGLVLGDAPFAAVCACFVLPLALIMAAVGNAVSIHFPVRAARRGENPFTTSSGPGCLTALVNLAGMMVAWLIALPVFTGAVLPAVLHRQALYGLTVPGAVLYAGLLYAVVLRYYSVGALERNEMRILEECLTGEPG